MKQSASLYRSAVFLTLGWLPTGIWELGRARLGRMGLLDRAHSATLH